MERGTGYGIRIERPENKGVTIYITHDGVDTGTSFSYLIDHITIDQIISTIRSWYMFGAISKTEDRDKLIADARRMWLTN